MQSPPLARPVPGGSGGAPARLLRDWQRAYSDGAATPAEVVDSLLARVGDRGSDGVWISLCSAKALHARVRDLERLHGQLAGRLDRLPLYGVPFAVKDNIDVAGLPTTAGCPDFARQASRTAPVVARLLDAGAILVGKTNLDQFATGLSGVRSPYGTPESVFGGRLIAGGSSSGSAVAVAAGLVAFALGTDTAGSGRVPAAMNGIASVKPTRGLLSTVGIVPACRSLDCVSVFAAELSMAAEVTALASGAAPDDPWSRRPAAKEVVRQPNRVRLGVPDPVDLDFADPALRSRFAAAVEGAGGRVAECVPVDLGPFREAGELLYAGPWVAERLADLGDFLDAHPASVLPVTRQVLESGRRFSAVDAFRAQHRLQELRAEVDRGWDRIDALLLPTVGATFTIEELEEDPIGRNLELGRYTQFANLLDLAAVTIPNGQTRDGRPASVSLVGPAFSDHLLARLGAGLAQPAPATDVTAAPADADTVAIAVVGRHLSGESHNHELTSRGAVLVETSRTAALYRLYRLPAEPAGLPGLVRVAAPGAAIEVEVWLLPAVSVGGLVAEIPAPLSLGWVRLADGRQVLGFLCEAYAAAARGAQDISASGGWRAYRATTREA
jgi:allophanate hydrolase